MIIFATTNTGLWKVSESGGVASKLTELDVSRDETYHAPPAFLPDGRHFLYLRSSVIPANTGVYIGSLDAQPEQQATRRLAAIDFTAEYAPSADGQEGYVLFPRDGTLIAQPFDSARLKLTGEAVPIAEDMGNSRANGWFSVSNTGTLAFRTGARFGQNAQLTWFDRQGRVLGKVGEPGAYDALCLSPDGARVAMNRRDVKLRRSVWLHDFARDTSTRFTLDPIAGAGPIWSPDGNRIVFLAGSRELLQKASNGATPEERLLKSDYPIYPNDFSSDGRFLIYTVEDPKAKSDLWLLPLSGDRKPIPYLRTESEEAMAQISPDSRWVAYRSDESGVSEIYVRPFPDASGGKWLVSQGEAYQPRWRKDGKELFYIGGDGVLMSVDVALSPTFKPGVPKRLVQTNSERGSNAIRYDVSPDGQRFLTSTDVDNTTQGSSPLTVVLNWTVLLKK